MLDIDLLMAVARRFGMTGADSFLSFLGEAINVHCDSP
jgi:hypothetical protein